MSTITHNDRAPEARHNMRRALLGQNAALRSDLFQPAQSSTLGRDIVAGLVVAAVVFGTCCALFALHII